MAAPLLDPLRGLSGSNLVTASSPRPTPPVEEREKIRGNLPSGEAGTSLKDQAGLANQAGLAKGVNERDWQCIFAVRCLGLFIGVFFDVLVKVTAEASSAEVAGREGSAAIWQTVRECGTAVEALIVGRLCAATRRREEDVAVRAVFIWTFAVRSERRKGGAALETVFLKNLCGAGRREWSVVGSRWWLWCWVCRFRR